MAMPAALKAPLGQTPEELCSLQFAEARRRVLEHKLSSPPLSDATNSVVAPNKTVFPTYLSWWEAKAMQNTMT